MSPALNRSTPLQHFERGNTVEIRNGIMFNFYLGLLHISNSCKCTGVNEEALQLHAVYIFYHNLNLIDSFSMSENTPQPE